jgi:predicted PhzF superfamily epimerase YddE/YHI9
MRIPIYQIDAFTVERFRGNPAAVCPLPYWIDDDLLQAIAAENNLSETAFLVRRDDGFDLRWFTPTTEVDLCGHATLASAHALVHPLGETADPLRFHTRSGVLEVVRSGHRLVMRFPALPARPVEPPPGAAAALGGALQEWRASQESPRQGNYLAVYASEAEVAALTPDIAALGGYGLFGFIATAPGESVDFVSRYFAPAFGVPEDPVTGSAHCVLAPYWADRLGRGAGERMTARQISPRGGDLTVSLHGDQVHLEGEAVLYLEGHIHVEVSGEATP